MAAPPANSPRRQDEQSAGNPGTRRRRTFAGQFVEATDRARSFFADYPPSSPSLALFKDGEVVHFVPRHAIEGRDPQSIAYDLVTAFDKHCASSAKPG